VLNYGQIVIKNIFLSAKTHRVSYFIDIFIQIKSINWNLSTSLRNEPC